MRISRTSLAFVALAFLAGCGGRGSTTLPPATTTSAAAHGTASVVVRVPSAAASSAHHRAPRYVSTASKSIAISVNAGPRVVANLTPAAPGCTTDASGTSCTIVVDAPAGSDTFEETLYDGTGATGNALSHAKVPATIVAGRANVVPITLDGVVASVSIALDGNASASAVRGTATTVPVTVTASDASGAAIIGDAYDTPIALTNSDTSGATVLSESAVQGPSDTVTLRYNGARILNATIAAAGLPQGKVSSATFRPKTGSTTAWTTWGFNAQRNGENPSETTISSSNAANLHQIWSFALSAKFSNTQPIVIPDVLVSSVPGGAYVDLVVVGDEHANLYAVNADDGSLVWRRELTPQSNTGCDDIPDQEFGITGTPAVDVARNRLYVVDGGMAIHALDVATGADSAGWPSGGVASGEDSTLVHDYSAPLYDPALDRIFVPTASYCDQGTYYGKLLAFSAATGSRAAGFQVIQPSTGDYGGGVWSYGGAALDPRGGSVYIATGNAMNTDRSPDAESIVQLDEASLSSLAVAPAAADPTHDDLDYGAGPVIFTPAGCAQPLLVAQRKNAVLNLYAVDPFGSGTNVAPLQSIVAGTDTANGENLASPVYSRASQMLYMTVASATPPGSQLNLQPGLAAFKVQNCNSLVLQWNTRFGAEGPQSQAIVANGVVYAGDGMSKTVHAVDANSGAQLWHSALSGAVFATPTVANGRLFVADWSGHLTAFAVPETGGASTQRRAR